MPNIINKFLEAYLIQPISDKIKNEDVKKVDNVASELMQLNIDPRLFNTRQNTQLKEQPEQTIRTTLLRDFSINYPVARACIDYLKTKVTQLEWDITSETDDGVVNEEQTKLLRKFFKQPSGPKSKLRNLMEQMIEDYLVIGAVSIEKVKTFGGELVELLPVDPTTIKLRLNEQGRTPRPPEIAYEQWILGSKKAELTTDELIFEVRNSRTNSPFGLSPLESLILQVQSALRGTIYNYEFFNDSNIPEGFVEMPESWGTDQIKEYQQYFDALMSGDPRFQRRLKFLPSGMKYTPTKKPEDMAFERFELWLLQVTCAVFGVPPQDIGFTNQINKATGEVQSEKGDERGKRPIAVFIEDIFTDIIQQDFEMDLAFKFLNVNPTDRLEEANIDKIRIDSGVLSVDEVRKKEGLTELGLKHFIMASGGPIMVEDIVSGAYSESKNVVTEKPMQEEPEMQDEDEMEDEMENEDEDMENDQELSQLERAEIRTWKKVAIKDFKENKTRVFKANYISSDIENEIKNQLKEVSSKEDIVKVFDFYLNGDYKTILKLKELANELRKSI